MTCIKCKAEMIFEPGQVDYRAKTDQGHLLSKTAAEHLASNRIKCNSCAQEFCVGCKSEGYHKGYTCAEFQKYKSAKKCKFCLKLLSIEGQACDDKECIEKDKYACLKKLQCGHECLGVKDATECLPCLDEECNKIVNKGAFCSICFI